MSSDAPHLTLLLGKNLVPGHSLKAEEVRLEADSLCPVPELFPRESWKIRQRDRPEERNVCHGPFGFPYRRSPTALGVDTR